jgi:putative DNA primase/helicase
MEDLPGASAPSSGYTLPLSGTNSPTSCSARDLADLSIFDIYRALGGQTANPKQSRGEAFVRCLRHSPDNHPSLHLNAAKGAFCCRVCGNEKGGGKLALVVFAGKASDKKSAWRWLVERGLLAERERANGGKHRTTAMFEYHSEDGSRFARVDRVEPGYKGSDKDFYPRLWEGTGYALRSKLNGKKLPLYRLPEVRRAIKAGERLFIVEGEGKGDLFRAALEAAKIAGAVTTIPGGSQAPLRDEHLQQLRGLKSAVILGDSDTAGRDAARSRAERIAHKLGAEVKLIDLYPEAMTTEHPAWAWDVADFLKDGGKVEDLLALIESAPLFTPSTTTTALAEAPQKAESKREVQLVGADTIPPAEREYVLYPYFPRSEVTWIEGSPRCGKTMAALSIISLITNGGVFANGEPVEPTKVAILSSEDSIEYELIPRLHAAGADLTRVKFIKVTVEDEEQQLQFFRDLPAIERQFNEENIGFVFVDGVFAFLGVKDSNSYSEAYAAMLPFIGMIRRRNMGSGIVRHTRKSGGEALAAGIGSTGYTALGRSTISIAINKTNKEERFFTHAGCTGAPAGDSFTFHIEGVTLPGFKRPTGAAVWGSRTDITADDAMGQAPTPTNEERSRLDEAREAILEALDTCDVTAATLYECVVRGQGVAKETFERARRDLRKAGLIEMTTGGFAGPKAWRKTSLAHTSLPDSIDRPPHKADEVRRLMTKYDGECPAPLSLLDSPGAVESVSEDVSPTEETVAEDSAEQAACLEDMTLDDQGRELL